MRLHATPVDILRRHDRVAAGHVHRIQPRQSGEQRDSGQEQGEKEQGAAEGIDDTRQPASHENADDPARVDGKCRGAVVVKGRKAASRTHRHHAPRGADGGVMDIGLPG